MEIFQYVPANLLYRTFYLLNRRLTSVIHSLPNLYWTLDEDWDEHDRSAPLFASRITTLIVKHDEQIDFTSFSNLRALKLTRPTVGQCNGIQPDLLPALEYLYIANFYFSDHSEQLTRLLFSPLFSRLRIFQIDRLTLMADAHLHASFSLCQLVISPSTWKSNLYEQLFHACPNLICLRIQRLRKVSFPMMPRFIRPHVSLRRLHIQVNSLEDQWFHHLDAILSVLPNLQDLALMIDQSEIAVEFPFHSLADLLLQHVPSLIFFKAKIPLNTLLKIEVRAIQRLHPLFTCVQFNKYFSRTVNSHLMISSVV